ncbi:hypothetical protein [Azorhizobium doebereinerae]|uniref:hypothetical protein n=1 Tax=Azorhizobium doebereinerae TaxID=281091 RepID=UPI0003F8394C|nr:hypothetical protein [Azorhizobium doebereinerae]
MVHFRLPAGWLQPAPTPAPAAPSRREGLHAAIREDVAAVIYERIFPTLVWGDATRSGKTTAYASADAVLHVLRPFLALPGPDAKA